MEVNQSQIPVVEGNKIVEVNNRKLEMDIQAVLIPLDKEGTNLTATDLHANGSQQSSGNILSLPN